MKNEKSKFKEEFKKRLYRFALKIISSLTTYRKTMFQEE